MLVLTRRMGQQVQLGDDIRVTVVRISEGSVRIGIEAPDSMSVMRTELLDITTDGHITEDDHNSSPAGC